jgi:translation initiation factor 3 subunit E
MAPSVAPPASPSASPALQHDLTPLVSPFLDLHQMFPLLAFVDDELIQKRGMYEPKTVSEARLALVRPTNMVDYAEEIYAELHSGKVDPAFAEQKKQVLATLDRLTGEAKPFSDLASDADQVQAHQAAGTWTHAGLSAHAPAVSAYRALSKFHYDCGDYQTSLNMLETFLSLGAADGPPPEEALGALWGKLSCHILLCEWEQSLAALQACRAAIEARAALPAAEGGTPPLAALQQRAWLLHWGLFVFWNNSRKGMDAIIDLFMSERYMQAIQTLAPHLLRYLAAAIIINKHKRSNLKELVKIIQHCDYTDPIIQ